ncbi:hypothetical protein Tsp_02808 [Trichinella spiralis]|uniref:hypothetical protein n=1 Tax=Trichinella spiralis TaxID=6334 RepID=UPI0001EFC598|nr:hypothetical protein Tsp_02808 [Trichinella spiralis]
MTMLFACISLSLLLKRRSFLSFNTLQTDTDTINQEAWQIFELKKFDYSVGDGAFCDLSTHWGQGVFTCSFFFVDGQRRKREAVGAGIPQLHHRLPFHAWLVASDASDFRIDGNIYWGSHPSYGIVDVTLNSLFRLYSLTLVRETVSN